MSATGSISVSGLLGGTAGQIDVTSLISQLMTAAALPQTQLKDQLNSVATESGAYQAVASKLTALQSAAQALTDPTAWTATAASSSTSSIVASSDGTASIGATTFSVTQLAQAQVTTIPVGTGGTVVPQPLTTLAFVMGNGSQQQVDLSKTDGSAAQVASAINSANIGVRATVVSADSGSVLQLASAKTGSANGFTVTGFTNDASQQTIVAAQNAQVGVGDPAAGGYTVSSSSNTFTNLIPGVTFSVSAPVTSATITVSQDETSISNKVQALVDAANTALGEISTDTAQGAVLQGQYDVRSVADAIMSAVSHGTSSGATLKTYGIDMNSTGTLSFDANAFATAYANDPAGTQAAVSSAFATNIDTATTAAIDPTNGSITQTISSLGTEQDTLNTSISNWTTRLGQIKDSLTTKYTAMEEALAKLQSQQTYLTSMFNSISGTSSTSGSGSSGTGSG